MTVARAFGIPPEYLDDKDKPLKKTMTLYDILEVQPSAKAEDIKVAFHKLARRHHPDTGDGDTDAWLKIKRAYEVLSDGEHRKKYDIAQKVLSQKVANPDENISAWPTPSWTPPKWSTQQYPGSSRTPVYPSSGSVGYAPARTTGLRVGYQIPSIGGMVTHVQSSIASSSVYVMHRVLIDATFPQQTVQNMNQSVQDFQNRDWWLATLRLDPSKYIVKKLTIITNSLYSLNMAGTSSLGMQFDIEVIET